MKSLFLILVLAVTVSAQESNFRVTAIAGASRGAGFESPYPGFQLGGTVSNGKIALDVSATYLFAKKIVGGGHNVGGDIVLRVHVKEGFFVGPAVEYSRQTTNYGMKSAWAIGVEGGNVSPSGNVVLSARFLQDLTSVNKWRSYTGKMEWYGPKRLYLAGEAGVADFGCYQTAAGMLDHCVSAGGSVSAGFYFK